MKRIITVGSFALLALALSAPMHAQDITQALTLNGFVQNQVCLNKDSVQVTLSATAKSDHNPIGFRWDVNNDGKWDTAINTDPTTIQVFPDEARVSVRVGAGNQAGDRAVSRFSFGTLKCR